MKRLSSILFIVYALVACRPGIPSDVLSEGDMVDILYDIHIAQAMAETHEGLKDGKDVVALRSAVLKKVFYCLGDIISHVYGICNLSPCLQKNRQRK